MENIETQIQIEESNEIIGWEHTTGFLPRFISTPRLESSERESLDTNNSSKYLNVKDELGYNLK